jgi:hypothetical protein
MRNVYKITNQLCGIVKTHKTQVKDKQGNALTTEKEQATYKVEHFK